MEPARVGRRTISNCRYIFLFLLFLLFSISLTIVTKGREMWLVIEATDVISVTHKPPGGGWRVRGNNGPFDTLRREFSTDSLITILRSCLEYRDKLESFPWEEASKNLSRPSNSSISLSREISYLSWATRNSRLENFVTFLVFLLERSNYRYIVTTISNGLNNEWYIMKNIYKWNKFELS